MGLCHLMVGTLPSIIILILLIRIQFISIILYLLSIRIKTSRIIISNNKNNNKSSSHSPTNNDCSNRSINSSSKNGSSINNSNNINYKINSNRNLIKSKKKSKITKIKNSNDSSILTQIYHPEYQKDQRKKYTQSLNFKHLCSLVLLKNIKTLQGSISIVRKIRKICQYSSYCLKA